MNNWFLNYSLPNDTNNEKVDEYIKLLENEKIVVNEDLNIQSKVEQLEINYNIKLKELEENCNKKNEIEQYFSKNSLEILQKELEIIKLLTKYALQTNQLNFDFFLSCLKFLHKLSEILRIRLGQKEIVHETKIYTPFNIPRCSYKFCNYKADCDYNYNIKNKNLCYQDHYVHRMVSADLSILIDYINQKHLEQNFIIHNKEILKTINTLSFVINHMESELKNKCMYLNESEYETCHFIKYK